MRRVTILMPCRDAAAHLEAAITSIREQTFAGYEVVAVDDGSVDGTLALLEAWAGRDRRVRILRTHGRGLVAALASGLAAAQGELVARMDADDIAEPDRLEKQVALMDEDPRVAACGTGIAYFPPDQVRDGARRYEAWINGLVTHREISRDIFIECPIPHPTLVIRRHVLLGVGGYRELGWPEDYDLVLRLWAAGYRMRKVPETLLRWRERPDRASRTDPRYADHEFRRIKIHFLRRTLLAAGRAAVICGAGPTGKAFARDLAEAGTRIAAFADLNPNKVGQEIHGAPVVAPAALAEVLGPRPPAVNPGQPPRPSEVNPGQPPRPSEVNPGQPPRPPSTRPLILAAVGQERAREEIRAECRRQGLVEMDDFVAVA